MAERQVNGVLLPDAEPRANGGKGRRLCENVRTVYSKRVVDALNPL